MRTCNAESQKKFSKRFQVKRRRQGFAHLEVITLWFQHLCMSQNVFEDFFDNLSNFTEFVIKNEKLLKNKSLYSQKFVIKKHLCCSVPEEGVCWAPSRDVRRLVDKKNSTPTLLQKDHCSKPSHIWLNTPLPPPSPTLHHHKL